MEAYPARNLACLSEQGSSASDIKTASARYQEPRRMRWRMLGRTHVRLTQKSVTVADGKCVTPTGNNEKCRRLSDCHFCELRHTAIGLLPAL